jgi:hypothetical protein
MPAASARTVTRLNFLVPVPQSVFLRLNVAGPVWSKWFSGLFAFRIQAGKVSRFLFRFADILEVTVGKVDQNICFG